jgi:ubiquinol-cytochrome c reductase iron-sulfur subunit
VANPNISTDPSHLSDDDPSRRDVILVGAGAFAVIGAAAVLWPLLDQMNPDASALSMASTDVDVAPIDEGQAITVMWRGKPIFVRHRTPAEIKEAEAAKSADLKDPQADSARVKPGHAEWLVLVGICTHLGCIPVGNKSTEMRGDYGGWFCPCHGSQYDTSGRIRQGPAPTNLEVPPYAFESATKIKIG